MKNLYGLRAIIEAIEAENTIDLNSILSDLGVTLADFDSAILDAE